MFKISQNGEMHEGLFDDKDFVRKICFLALNLLIMAGNKIIPHNAIFGVLVQGLILPQFKFNIDIFVKNHVLLDLLGFLYFKQEWLVD